MDFVDNAVLLIFGRVPFILVNWILLSSNGDVSQILCQYFNFERINVGGKGFLTKREIGGQLFKLLYLATFKVVNCITYFS